MSNDVHITHRNDGSWAVIREGADRASSLHSTQGDAIDAGQEIARNNQSELVIHDRDNRIREAWSYGNDPQRSPG